MAEASPVRMAVVGAGAFGRNHLRVIAASPNAQLVALVDADPQLAAQRAEEFGCEALLSLASLKGRVDAAVVAVPTIHHEAVALELLAAGIDVLVEKPLAPDLAAAERIAEAAQAHQRILQVGHLERFNPAISALRQVLTVPLFFEIHRLSLPTTRSLDVDVVLDLMIHDLDLVLWLTGQEPAEVRAAGISILSSKVDIANVRLSFASGCVANLTASRISTESVRKLRLFQPGQYLSLDYTKQQLLLGTVIDEQEIDITALPVPRDEPLRLELESFFHCVQHRTPPLAGGPQAVAALRLAEQILVTMEQHAQVVAATVASHQASS